MTHFNTVNTSVAALVFRLLKFCKSSSKMIGCSLNSAKNCNYILQYPISTQNMYFYGFANTFISKIFRSSKNSLANKNISYRSEAETKNHAYKNVLQYLSQFPWFIFVFFCIKRFILLTNESSFSRSLSAASNHKTLEMMLTETHSTLDVVSFSDVVSHLWKQIWKIHMKLGDLLRSWYRFFE